MELAFVVPFIFISLLFVYILKVISDLQEALNFNEKINLKLEQKLNKIGSDIVIAVNSLHHSAENTRACVESYIKIMKLKEEATELSKKPVRKVGRPPKVRNMEIKDSK